jgi:hypothetical protein
MSGVNLPQLCINNVPPASGTSPRLVVPLRLRLSPVNPVLSPLPAPNPASVAVAGIGSLSLPPPGVQGNLSPAPGALRSSAPAEM